MEELLDSIFGQSKSLFVGLPEYGDSNSSEEKVIIYKSTRFRIADDLYLH
jgi:hypothetical protein